VCNRHRDATVNAMKPLLASDARVESWIVRDSEFLRSMVKLPRLSSRRFGAAVLLLLWISGLLPCDAAATSGGFENGALAPWVLTGAGAVVSKGAFSPAVDATGGQFMGYITTLNNEGAADFGFFNESPDIDGNGVKEIEYSALSITFTTAVPSMVCVQLNFLTDEVTPGNPSFVNDADVFGLATDNVRTGPFAVLLAAAATDGAYTGLAQRLAPEAFFGGEIVQNNSGVFPTIPDSSRFQGQTGFTKYSFQVAAGVHAWTFFVADSHTDGVASAMLIDDFTITPFPGTAETVIQVADINPGTRGSYPSFLTAYRDQLYFRGNTGLNDTELWRFDGTNALRAADIVPGLSGSSPANLAVLGDLLFFNASTPAGYRLWCFDGTNAVRVTNANPPSAFLDGGIWKPVVWLGELWYPSAGRIQRFDGARFAGLNTPPFAQQDLALWNGALYYGAQDSTSGVELWRFNGSTQTRLTDIHPGVADAYPESIYPTVNGVYFRAQTSTHGMELYRYDRSVAFRVGDINPGPAGSNPGEFCAFAGSIYFSADDGVHGYELWRTDGTNVTLVADINPNPVYEAGADRLSDSHPHRLTDWRSKLYFVASNGSEDGLWSYDGTNVCLIGGGTANTDGNLGGVTELIVFNDRLYFDADDGVNGRELWRIEPNPERRLSIASGGAVLQVQLGQAETGRYVIEATSDFVEWTPLATNNAVDGQVSFVDGSATNLPTRFYRAVATH
jgi:ELWxxDGT repeat protein